MMFKKKERKYLGENGAGWHGKKRMKKTKKNKTKKEMKQMN